MRFDSLLALIIAHYTLWLLTVKISDFLDDEVYDICIKQFPSILL